MKHQEKIVNVLNGKKIPYNKVDISADPNNNSKMKKLCGNYAVVPQILYGDANCANYEDFEEAIELEMLVELLNRLNGM